MKRFLVLVLVLLIAMGFVACGEQETNNNDTNDTSSMVENDTYTGAVERYIAACKGDWSRENLSALAPMNFWQRWADHENDGNMDQMFAELDEEGKEEAAEGNQVTYVIENEQEVTKEELETIHNILQTNHDLVYDSFTVGYRFVLKTTKTVKLASEDSNNTTEEQRTNTDDVVAVKMGDTWYLIKCKEANGVADYMWLIDAAI